MSNPFKRRAIDPTDCSLIELCLAASGSYRKAPGLAVYVLQWRQTTHDLGREPTVDEFGEAWNISRRKSYYEQAKFREAFDSPPLLTPAPIVAAMDANAAAAKAERQDFTPVLVAA